MRFKKNLGIVVLVCLTLGTANAQPPTHTSKFSPFIDNNINGFWEYLPRDYSIEDKKYPLLIFLHGAGESGDIQDDFTIRKVLRAGPPKLIESGGFPETFNVGGKEFKFIVLSPQIKNGIYLASSIISPSTIQAVIDYAKATYRVDPNRIYLAGSSMGGGGVWDYAGSDLTSALSLAAILVACGAADLSQTGADNIARANLPVLATHNQDDNVIMFSRAQANINAIEAVQPKIQPAPKTLFWLTGGHNVWRRTFEDILPGSTPNGNLRDSLGMNVYEWALQFTRAQEGSLPVTFRSFYVEKRNNQIFIEWVVSNQVDIVSYVVEKSEDGRNWSPIAKLQSKEGPGEIAYQSTDIVRQGEIFYRIRSEEKNGSHRFSAIRKIVIRDTKSWATFPNPFVNRITVTLPSPNEKQMNLYLIDQSGRIIESRLIQKMSYGFSVENLDRLPAGSYILKLVSKENEVLYQEKLIKK